MICTNCGNQVPKSAKVCGHCGHRLVSIAPPPTASPGAQEQPHAASPSAPLPGWIWAVGGISLAALAFWLWPQISANGLLGFGLADPGSTPGQAQLAPDNFPATRTSPATQPPATPQPPTLTPDPWLIVLNEDFSSASRWDIQSSHRVEGGKLILSSRINQNQAVPLIIDGEWNHRISLEMQWLSGNPDGCGIFDISLAGYKTNQDALNRGWSESDLNFIFLPDGSYEIVSGFEPEWLVELSPAPPMAPNGGLNHVQIEIRDSSINIFLNDQALVKELPRIFVEPYFVIYLSHGGSVHGGECGDETEIAIDNLVIEEYR